MLDCVWGLGELRPTALIILTAYYCTHAAQAVGRSCSVVSLLREVLTRHLITVASDSNGLHAKSAQMACAEKILDLGDGLTVAYEELGDSSSSTVVIFLHGALSVGIASRLHPALEERRVHYIAPTLPGWGNSSPVPPNSTYHDHLCRCITALLQHSHPVIDGLRLYISGGSFGSAIAQMLYGAPYDKFPYGKQIVAVLLLAPFSPFYCHKEYAKCLSTVGWLGVGPLAKNLPFRLLPRLGVAALKTKINTPDRAKKFMNEFVLKNMGPKERDAFKAWKERENLKDGEEFDVMADSVYRSTQRTWEGFLSLAEVLHSNWGGYNPAELDDEHAKPVFIVVTKEDKETLLMGEWLAGKLKHSVLRYEEGGHVGSLFVLDDIWEDFMNRYS